MPDNDNNPPGGNANTPQAGTNPPLVAIALAAIAALGTVGSAYFASSAYSHKNQAAASASHFGNRRGTRVLNWGIEVRTDEQRKRDIEAQTME
jgi:hypothetical protein